MRYVPSLTLILSYLTLLLQSSSAVEEDPYIQTGKTDLTQLFNATSRSSPRPSSDSFPQEPVYSNHNTNPFVTPRSARTTARTPRTPRTPTSTPGGSLRSSTFYGSQEVATMSASPRLENLRKSAGSQTFPKEGLALKVTSTAESDSEEPMDVETSSEPMEVETESLPTPPLSGRRNSLGTPLAYKGRVKNTEIGPNKLALSLNLSSLTASAPQLRKTIGLKSKEGSVSQYQKIEDRNTPAQSMRLVNLENGFRRAKKNYDFKRRCYFDSDKMPPKQPKREALSNRLGHEHTLWWGRAKKMADEFNTKRMFKINLEDNYKLQCAQAQAELGIGQVSFEVLDELEKLYRPVDQGDYSKNYAKELHDALEAKKIHVSVKDIESILPRFSSNFKTKMTAIREEKKQVEIAAREFEVIQKRCQIQHVVRGKLTEIQNLTDQVKLFHFQSDDEMMLRSFSLTEEDLEDRKLFDSEDGEHVIFKLTDSELEDYMYSLRRNYNVSTDPFVHPYQNNPKQLTGSNRVKCFGLSLQDLEIEIQILQMWLNEHLIRESQIFDAIITQYGGNYCDKAHTSFEAIQLQLKFDFNPTTVTVGKQQNPLIEREAIKRQFVMPIFGQLLEPDMKNEETDSSLDEIYLLERQLDQRYKRLQQPENFLPFNKAYVGLDIRTRYSHPCVIETERKRECKTVSRRAFFKPTPTYFEKIIRRNYNSCIDSTEEITLSPFTLSKQITMAEDFPSIEIVELHRKRFIAVLEDLRDTNWISRRQNSFNGPKIIKKLQDTYDEHLTKWEASLKVRLETSKKTRQDKMLNRPEQRQRPESVHDKLALHGELLAAYRRNVIRQSSQLDKLKGPPKGWVEAAYGYWSVKPFSFFFDNQSTALSDVFLEIGAGKIDLSSLQLTDPQLNRRRLVRDETDPGLFNSELALCAYSVIDLSCNRLENPRLLRDLRWTLRCLDLSNNALIGLEWALELEYLEVLNVSNNPGIKTLAKLKGSSVSSLKELNIANIGLTALSELDILRGFMGLEILDISFNLLEQDDGQFGKGDGTQSKPPKLITLSAIPLEILIAHECGFDGLWNDYFGYLVNLRTLSVERNNLQWLDSSWDQVHNKVEFQDHFPKLQVFVPQEGKRIEAIDGTNVSLDHLNT